MVGRNLCWARVVCLFVSHWAHAVFVGVALSESGGVILVGLGRQIICLGVGLAQFFVLLS